MSEPLVKREFKGIWIPKEIWLDKFLSIQEKLVLTEIDSFEAEQGCFASNKYLGEIVQLSPSRVSNIITRLTEMKYVKTEIIYRANNRAIQMRILRVNKLKIYGEKDK